MNTIAQAVVTLATAQNAYHRVSDAIRERHNPAPSSLQSPETWEVATTCVVTGLADWEAVAVMRYLATRTGLAEADVILAEALAARLGLTLTFARREIT